MFASRNIVTTAAALVTAARLAAQDQPSTNKEALPPPPVARGTNGAARSAALDIQNLQPAKPVASNVPVVVADPRSVTNLAQPEDLFTRTDNAFSRISNWAGYLAGLAVVWFAYRGTRYSQISSLTYGRDGISAEGQERSARIGVGSFSVFELLGADPVKHVDMFLSWVMARRRPHLPLLTFSERGGKRIFDDFVRNLNAVVNAENLIPFQRYNQNLREIAAAHGLKSPRGLSLESRDQTALRLFLSLRRTRADLVFLTYDCATTEQPRFGIISPESVVDMICNPAADVVASGSGSVGACNENMRQYVRTLEFALTMMVRSPATVREIYLQNAVAEAPMLVAESFHKNPFAYRSRILKEINRRQRRFDDALEKLPALLPLLTTNQDESIQALVARFGCSASREPERSESAATKTLLRHPEGQVGSPLTPEGIRKILRAWYKRSADLTGVTTLEQGIEAYQKSGRDGLGRRYFTVFNSFTSEVPPNFLELGRRPRASAGSDPTA